MARVEPEAPDTPSRSNSIKSGSSTTLQIEDFPKPDLETIFEAARTELATLRDRNLDMAADPPCRSKPGDPVLVIGIDFGTTFTGVAHAFTARYECRPEKVLIIRNWSGSNQTWDKVPTKFAYKDQFESAAKRIRVCGGSAPIPTKIFNWGHETELDDVVIECIKLILAGNRQLPKHIRREEIVTELAKHGKTVEDAVVDYLHEILKKTQQTVIDKYGESCVEGTERIIVITVPAIWSDADKDAMKCTAMRAGFAGNILIVSEPEAAAIWAIQNMPSLSVEVNDHIMVCDAGGGTVDIIPYKITKLSPLRMKESMTGSGGDCGASFVNGRFEQRVSDKIGLTAFAEFKANYPERWHNAMKEFEENAKRNFNPHRDPDKPDRVFSIYCHGIPNEVAVLTKDALGRKVQSMVKGGCIRLTTADLDEIFEPIVTEVIDLMAKQLEGMKTQDTNVKAILLVGGFGQSDYLLRRVRAHFKPRGIEVLQPPEAWSAVARGAVLWASENQEFVESRIARYHYGTDYAPRFENGTHPQSSMFYCTLREGWLSSERFHTYIKQGDTVSTGTPISHDFHYQFRLGGSLSREIDLYVSAASSVPKSVNELNVRKLCSLVIDLSVVPERHFKQKVNSKGVRFKSLGFELKMQLESGGLRFWFEVDGIEYYSMTAEFD